MRRSYSAKWSSSSGTIAGGAAARNEANSATSPAMPRAILIHFRSPAGHSLFVEVPRHALEDVVYLLRRGVGGYVYLDVEMTLGPLVSGVSNTASVQHRLPPSWRGTPFVRGRLSWISHPW